MAGNPQGRDINEAGEKSVTLVTIDDAGSVHIEERHTGIAQFERITVDATGLEDWRELVSAVAQGLEQKREATLSEYLVARLEITGMTPLAWQMRRDNDLLMTEAEDRAAQAGNSWIEKLEIDAKTPRAIRRGQELERNGVRRLGRRTHCGRQLSRNHSVHWR